MSTIPMMVMTHGKPMVSAMDPPIDGPTPGTSKADVGSIWTVLASTPQWWNGSSLIHHNHRGLLFGVFIFPVPSQAKLSQVS